MFGADPKKPRLVFAGRDQDVAAGASFVAPEVILQGLRHLRPELTRRLAALDAAEAKLAMRMRLYQPLELDLARSVLQTYLRWLNRTEKALTRDIRAGEPNTWGS